MTGKTTAKGLLLLHLGQRMYR